MTATLFTKIIAGEIPCHRVYEDSQVFAFLDIGPLASGHTLLVPKEPVERLDQLSDETGAALGKVLPRLGRAIMAATGVAEYNVVQKNGPLAGQVVPHVHFHIIPKPDAGSGMVMEWQAEPLTQEAGQAMAQQIREQLA